MPSSAYLDFAATTPMRPEAVAAMTPFLSGTFGNPSGGHAVARAAKTALEEAREAVAGALGASPGEVVFTAGGSEADNLAVKGAARAARAAGLGDGVVTAAFEHKAVLASCDRLEREGFRVARVGADRDGIVDLDALADALDDRTVVVSVMLVNNEVGTIQPLDAIAELVRARAPRAVLHTDAVQAVPWLPVDRATQPAQLVSISAHKFGGPKGTGALVVRGGVPIEPLIEGGGQEQGLRSGTSDVAGAVAMAAALEATAASRDADGARIAAAAGSARRRPARVGPGLVRERRPQPEGCGERAPRLRRRRGRGAPRAARRGGRVRGRRVVVLVGCHRAVARARVDGRPARRRAVVDPAQPRLRLGRRRRRHRARRRSGSRREAACRGRSRHDRRRGCSSR